MKRRQLQYLSFVLVTMTLLVITSCTEDVAKLDCKFNNLSALYKTFDAANKAYEAEPSVENCQTYKDAIDAFNTEAQNIDEKCLEGVQGQQIAIWSLAVGLASQFIDCTPVSN